MLEQTRFGSPGGPEARWRRLDPWLIAAFLAPVVLLPLLAGERIGEPVADDFDFLLHVLLTGQWSWFDGCGANNYWRPLGRQAYYATFAPWMLHGPLVVALVQLGCLCLTAILLYRSFVPALGRGAAFAVSTGPWMMESSRLLVAWPACFQDVGALLFVSLALHEAVMSRRWSFLAAGLAALLCKEVAAIALIAMVACPAVRFNAENQRRLWLVSSALLVSAWVALYGWVTLRASLALQVAATPLSSTDWARGMWLVPWWSFKAIWSMPPSGGPQDVLLVVGLIALTPWPRVRDVFRSEGLRLQAWWRWGFLWSIPLVLALIPFYPGWGPYRMAFAGFGLLTAAVVTLRAIHPHAVPAFLALRLGLLLLAPKPVHEIASTPPFRGASIDIPRLSRLQRLVPMVRAAIQSRYPTLPHGATVVWEGFPTMVEYAFGSGRALCVWYRDTTLRWVPISRWMTNTSSPAAVIVEFQDLQNHEVALVESDAMRAMLQANDDLNLSRETESLTWLARAESLQADTSATLFRRSIAGKRAYALASLSFKAGRYVEARSHLHDLLAIYPGDVPGNRMLSALKDTLAHHIELR